MAGSFTDVLEVDVLKAVTGQTTTILTTTALAAIYISLHTTASTDASAGTEVSGGSYARQDSKGKWAAPSAGSVATNASVAYPQATASWGTVTNIGVNDASTAGNRLAWGDLTANKTVDPGDTLSFASGAITITLD